MPPDFSQIGPFLFAALIVFAIYRRFRRSFGRQALRPGRMILRMVVMEVPHAADAGGAYVADAANPSLAFAPTSMVRSPLTVGIFFVLAGYYLWYYGSVLWKSKHLKAEDI
jgi:hypothetical protein